MATSLLEAKTTLDQLNDILQSKILRIANGTSRARRRAWMRNKSKVSKLCSAIRDHKLNLIAAMDAQSLRTITRGDTKSLMVERRLSDIQRSINETHNAILSQSIAVSHFLNAMPRDATYSSSSGSNLVGEFCNEDTLVGSDAQIDADYSVSSSGSGSMEGPDVRQGCIQQPASSFELSPKFFPEAYSDVQRLPPSCFMVIEAFELNSSGDFKTNLYSVLYLCSPRRWRRFDMYLSMHRSSRYWALTKIAKDGGNPSEDAVIGCATLPHPLLTSIQRRLRVRDLHGVVDFRMKLTSEDYLQEQYDIPSTHASPTNSRANRAHLDALGYLDDLGCPRYLESNVMQIEVIEPPNRFVSCVNGIIVYEYRLIKASPTCELLYNIKVLHSMAMDRVLGIARLVGIVLDVTRRYLRGYLFEFQNFPLRLDKVAENSCISWTIREKWAKQLVQRVDQLHRRGFVVGTLCNSPILINDMNRVHLWIFRRKFHTELAFNPCFPPEYRYLRKASSISSDHQLPDRTTKSDIYQLGMVLWLLAEKSPWTSTSAACIRARCNQRPRICEDQSHIDPIALPPLDQSIPVYYREMVVACRAKCPYDRPAAWKLLQSFPSSISDDIGPRVEPESNNVSRLGYVRCNVGCDRCRKRDIEPVFHCTVCKAGDFDICQSCFDKGIHCDDADHILVEMNRDSKGKCVVPGRYHSVPDTFGKRYTMEP